MKILIDLQPYQGKSRNRGMGRYAKEITRALLKLGDNVFDFYLLLNDVYIDEGIEIRKEFKELISQDRFVIAHIPNFKNYFELYTNTKTTESFRVPELSLELALSQINPDFILITSLFDWSIPTSVKKLYQKGKIGVIVYDLIPIIFKEKYLVDENIKAHYFYKLKELRQADLYFVISEATKKDLIEHLNIKKEKIIVIYGGCDKKFKPINLSKKDLLQSLLKYGISKDFILYMPGGYDFRKNVEGLLQAYGGLPKEIKLSHQLVIGSKLDEINKKRLENITSSVGLSLGRDVVFTGYVPDEDLVVLYNACKLFVYPSLYEGFGLPVLEAMRCGAPVIGSNTSSIPEIIEDKRALFNPYSIEDMQKLISKALTDENFRMSLVENSFKQKRRFSWDYSASKILKAVQDLEMKKTSFQVFFNLKPKLAYISTFSSEKHKTIFYSQELLVELSKYYDIELIVDHPIIEEPLKYQFPIRSSEEFLKKINTYQRILYYFGNSLFHRPMSKLLEKVPGIVIFHEIPIFNSFYQAYTNQYSSNFFQKEIYYSLGYTALKRLKEKKKIDNIMRNYPLNLSVLNNSVGIIVHSQFSLNLLKKFYPEFSEEFVKVIPHLTDLYNETNLQNTKKKEKFNIKQVVKKYHQAIEELYSLYYEKEFVSKLPYNLSEKDITNIAKTIALNTKPKFRQKQLLIDVSTLANEDLGTGIQRVVKAQLKNLIEDPPYGYRVEPIYLTHKDGFWSYKYARKFTLNFLDIQDITLKDEYIEFHNGDIFFAPDLFPGVTEAYKYSKIYHLMRLKGLKIVFLVYDLLPIIFPQYFPLSGKKTHENWLKSILNISNKIICISESVANEVRRFISQKNIKRDDLEITHLHLGADFKVAKHKEFTKKEENILKKIKKRSYFIMVSTIEPRKGHAQVLSAFEILWSKGYDLSLVFVGKQGWMVESLIKRIKRHPELNKRFFWTGHISDDMLEELYKGAIASIIASEGEGFGLPIIESAYHGKPIIARDIPVFREVAGKGAYYFPNTKDPQALAAAIENWLKLYKENKYPEPSSIRWMTWEEHCEKLKEILLS